MDADLSHNPEYIPKFLEDLEFADVVVGSRYVEGGRIDRNWSVGRRVLSIFANIIIRNVSGIRIRDASSGYKAYRVNVLKELDLGLFRCKGFGFQIEVIHALENRGYTIWEHPINFTDRTCGKSKMTVRILLEALCRLLLLRWRPI
jgi:dolichol-phosphate mannosyltransferase